VISPLGAITWTVGFLDVSGGLRGHGCHHCFGGHGRKNQVFRLHALQYLHLRRYLPHLRQLGMGRYFTAAAGWTKLGFIDFAGSTVVHSVGGWAALAGAIVLGPRIGKFTKDGKVRPIHGT
jgi:hypothetical protein